MQRECETCRKIKECVYGPDLYQLEINNDDTPIWQCAECAYESLMDI